ncbi:MAG: phenylacetate-CoA oxygenase subunit PaaC [Nitriliruptorales bacterium]|nr:phenylacetate-CoA oxygenase subunit PaaC [Nitriliruptorales bacterium]
MRRTAAEEVERVSDPRLHLLLALADDELIMGHQHGHWTGVAPHIEEDLAFSSISQDEIGHSVVWYGIAAELSGKDPDTLALGRPPDGYLNAILVERPPRDWGYTLARHYLYDTAEDVRLATLAESSWTAVAGATGAIRREERYHLLHARLWLDRLAKGPVEARSRLVDGLLAALSEAPGLFEALPGEDELVAEGVLPVTHEQQRRRWLEMITADLSGLGLDHVLDGESHHTGGEFVPTSSGELLTDERGDAANGTTGGGLGGRHGRHSEDFAQVWEEMTGTYRAHPGASW